MGQAVHNQIDYWKLVCGVDDSFVRNMFYRKQTSVYKDNNVSEFHFENHGIHSQFSRKSHS